MHILTRIYVYETLSPNRCEPRIEVIIKLGPMGGQGFFLGGVRVDVNAKIFVGGVLGTAGEWGARAMGVGRGGGGWLVARLGVGGNVGYGGCEPRIGGIVQCTKRYYSILRKLKK